MADLSVIVPTALLTLAGVLLLQNLSGGEKKIQPQLPRLTEGGDAEFRRALSGLLGPHSQL